MVESLINNRPEIAPDAKHRLRSLLLFLPFYGERSGKETHLKGSMLFPCTGLVFSVHLCAVQGLVCIADKAFHFCAVHGEG